MATFLSVLATFFYNGWPHGLLDSFLAHPSGCFHGWFNLLPSYRSAWILSWLYLDVCFFSVLAIFSDLTILLVSWLPFWLIWLVVLLAPLLGCHSSTAWMPSWSYLLSCLYGSFMLYAFLASWLPSSPAS